MKIKDEKLAKIFKFAGKTFREHKKEIAVLSFLGVLGGFLEGIGINALVPLLSLVLKEESPATDFITKALSNAFAYFHLSFNLTSLVVFVVVIFILKAALVLLFNYISIRITAEYRFQIRSSLFKKALKSSWPFLLQQRIGYLEKILMDDANIAASVLAQISSMVLLGTSLIIYLVVAFNISAQITLITLLFGAVIFLVFKPIIYKIRENSRKTIALNKEMAHSINENIIGMKTIKALAVERAIGERAESNFDILKTLGIKAAFLNELVGGIMQPLTMIFIVGVFSISYLTPGFSFASFLVVMYLIQKIFSYFESFQGALRKMSERVPNFQYAIDFENRATKHKEKAEGKLNFKLKDKLEFSDIQFGYSPSKLVLSGVDFTLKKGEMLGLIGPSGAGKTTIVDLLLRLLHPTSGEILLDGKLAEEIKLHDWRKKIGYVSQDVFLIEGTIADNIKFYASDVSKQEVETAAKMANIYDFVAELPDGFDTLVGDRGVLLSAGQRQRIALARVLARNPEVLVLDEATSSLDNESELAIQKSIESLRGKITILVIAHRLSSVLSCDELMVLENGKIIEKGKPQDLLNDNKSYFYKVYNIRD